MPSLAASMITTSRVTPGNGPSINGGVGPAIGLPETASTLLFGGLFLLSYGWFGGRYPMLSPRLAADALERERH